MSDLDEVRHHAAKAAFYARIGIALATVSLALAATTFVLLVAL